MSPSIHPPQAQAGSEKRGGSEGEEYLAYRSLCFAGQQLIWNRPPNISAHTYRNERSSASLLPPSPLFFRWQHDLHFVSGSFSFASSASLDLSCMRALARLTLSCCQPCSGSVSYFTFISAASSSPLPPSLLLLLFFVFVYL